MPQSDDQGAARSDRIPREEDFLDAWMPDYEFIAQGKEAAFIDLRPPRQSEAG